MSTAILQMSAVELLGHMQRGEFSARQVVDTFLAEIDRTETALHSFLHIDHEGARRAAASIDERRSRGERLGMLAGLPVAVKDVLCTTDQPTTCASKILARFQPPYDATVVAR